jgi:hypothetical protein
MPTATKVQHSIISLVRSCDMLLQRSLSLRNCCVVHLNEGVSGAANLTRVPEPLEFLNACQSDSTLSWVVVSHQTVSDGYKQCLMGTDRNGHNSALYLRFRWGSGDAMPVLDSIAGLNTL